MLSPVSFVSVFKFERHYINHTTFTASELSRYEVVQQVLNMFKLSLSTESDQ